MIDEDWIEKIQIQEASRWKVLFVDQDAAVLYVRGRLLFFDLQGNQIADFALRPQPRCLFRLNDTEFLISGGGFLWNYNTFSHQLKKEFTFAKGTVSPLAFCVYERRGIKEVIFGDYGGHDEEGRVGIYLRKLHQYKKLSSFPGYRIDHVHRVSYDPFRDCFWVFTGDFSKGSGIWKMDYLTGALSPFLVGSKQYRSHVSFIREDSILYATDSLSEQNYIYEIGIDTKQLRKLYRLPGPCLSGTQIYHNHEPIFCFSTSAREDDVSGRQRGFSRRQDLGVTDRFSHIILGSANGTFHEIGRNKGRLGSHEFPQQSLADEIVFVPQSCRYKNGHTFRVRWEKEGSLPE